MIEVVVKMFIIGFVGMLILFPILLIYDSKERKRQNNLELDALKKENFTINKVIYIDTYNSIYIDDHHKRFAIGNRNSLTTFRYEELLGFSLIEDGNTISQSKTMATVIGGLTFGVVGAIVGSSGKRKMTNTCNSLVVCIVVNDLEEPRRVLKLIENEVQKDSFIYKNNIEVANNIIATLKYIESNK